MTITKILPDGIYYINTNGAKQFVDFKECNENWLAYRKRKETLTDEQVAELRGKDKTTGQRDIHSQEAYIELFTKPFTRFVFSNPTQMDEYRKVRDTMYSFGWTTHDLS